MLHQTCLISSSSSSSSPSPYSSSSSAASSLCKPFLSSSSSSSPSTSHSSQVPNTAATPTTTHMEPFKTVFLQQQQQAAAMGEEGVFVGERGNNTLFGGAAGDSFFVEELLDLGEFSDHLDAPHADRKELEREKFRPREVKRESSNSSDITFDLPPPPSVIDLPVHVAEELEWVSMMMDDSLSEVPDSCTALPPMAPIKKQPPCEAKLRPTLCALSTECRVPVKARRSKRSRAAFWSLSGSDNNNNSSSSSSTASSCSSSSYLFYDSPFVTATAEAPAFFLDDSPVKKQKPRKRGRKPKATNTSMVYQCHHQPVGTGSERRCSHCGVSKTPQWRAGPEGAKTLCNACGVRYKSGRLLPEYRPACSPTFSSELHSNSHRKVLEMRRKKESSLVEVSAPAVASF